MPGDRNNRGMEFRQPVGHHPLIAALHGHVVGYGMWISLDADIRIAAEDTSFWLPEPQWGIATIPAAWTDSHFKQRSQHRR